MSIYTPFSEEQLIPKEERIEVVKKSGKFSIGIPKESELQEKRVCLTPDAVQVLVSRGHDVMVESNAGEGAYYTDNQYSEAGAQIVYDKKTVFSQPIVLKVEPPTEEEIAFLQPNSYLLSAVQINARNKDYFKKLCSKKVTAIGFEYLRDAHNQLSIVRLIGEIAGTTSILIAGELLSNTNGGNGLLLGGVTGVRPTDVVIIGAGTVGEYAAKGALGLGATVRIFDNSLTRLKRLQSELGYRVSTSTIDPKELEKALMRCDVVIGALRGKTRSPIVVTETMVQKMKKGSVMIDLSIDSGGCFETSQITTLDNPTFIKDDIIHYCVPNITSRVARTSTKALSNFFLSYFLDLEKEGGFEVLFAKYIGIRKGIYVYKGRLTFKSIADEFDMPYHDINLLIIS